MVKWFFIFTRRFPIKTFDDRDLVLQIFQVGDMGIGQLVLDPPPHHIHRIQVRGVRGDFQSSPRHILKPLLPQPNLTLGLLSSTAGYA